MAQLLELKRLKDLKVVGVSSTNGNIKLDGVETTVYTHPSGTNPHGTTKSDVGLGNCDNTSDLSKPISTLTQTALNLKVDKIAGKSLISDTEITRLSGITTSATKVETSATNGNIKINGVESNVYTNKQQKINTNWVLNGDEYDIFITKENIDDIILININNMNIWDGRNLNYNIILSDDIININDGFFCSLIYYNYCGGNYHSYIRNIYLRNTNKEILKSIVFNTKGSENITNGYSTMMTIAKDKDIYGFDRYYIYNDSLNLSQSLDDKIKAINSYSLGLGNVPNVSTNDQTPTYTEATNNTTLTSGEKISIAFGKISKAISSLISHLSDNISHITSTERTNWNKSVPYITNTVSMTVEVSDIVKSVTISHSLGYIPKTLVYVESIENSKTFLTQLPIIYSSGNGISVKVSNDSIIITYDRTNGTPLSIPLTHTFRYRIYKEEL